MCRGGIFSLKEKEGGEKERDSLEQEGTRAARPYTTIKCVREGGGCLFFQKCVLLGFQGGPRIAKKGTRTLKMDHGEV